MLKMHSFIFITYCIIIEKSLILQGGYVLISKKGKRKIEYNGIIFYWFIRKNSSSIPKIHILSEDKKINLEYSLFDTEVSTTKKQIEELLKMYFQSKEA